MPFAKGDPNINRGGRPRKAEIDLLRQALNKHGQEKGKDFWDEVAKKAFTNPSIMLAIVKKFVPDLTHSSVESKSDVYHHILDELTDSDPTTIRGVIEALRKGLGNERPVQSN